MEEISAFPELTAIGLKADLTLAAASDQQPLPRLELIANTGVPFRVASFADPVVVDLAGVTFASDRLPILQDHDTDKRVGHTSRAVVANGQIEASAIVSSRQQLANEIVADLANGFPFQASIGADVLKAERIPAGKTIQVNGRDLDGPLIVARQTRVGEISVTVFGADRQTATRLAASRKRKPKMSEATDTFNVWLEAMGLDRDMLSDTQHESLNEQFDELHAHRADSRRGSDRLEDLRHAEAGEEMRLDAIRAVFKKPEYDEVRQVTVGTKKLDLRSFKKLALTEINEDGQPAWSPDAVELRLMQAYRDRVPAFSVQSVDAEDINGQALSAALCREVAGIPDSTKVHAGLWYEKEVGLKTLFDERTLDASHSKEIRKYASLHALMDLTIQLAGNHYSGSRKSNDFIRTFQRSRHQLQAAGGFTTLEASNLLEDVANKSLLAAFEAQEVVWPLICGVESVADFKTHNRYRLIVGGGYARVGADGELKHGSLKDEKETIRAGTYGEIIALTREHMINDDLGAFMAIPQGLGRLANLRIEEEVFVAILGNAGTFWGSGNNNYIEGATTVIGIAGLTAAEKTFGNFVDTNGLPILVSADRILVGTGDFAVANQLFTSTELRGQTAGTEAAVDNPHAMKFRPIKSPYLNNTAIKRMETGAALSGQSDTHWWLFANPDRIASVVVAFLNGRRTPILEQEEASFEKLGMQWRSYHDWGVALGSEEGSVKSKGAV